MKKSVALVLLFLACTVVIQAKPVDKAVAARYAALVLHKGVVDATPARFTECYLFSGADGEGFALIAADDCVRPLLAYSHDGTFDAAHMPAHVEAWIDGYRREIASVVEAGIAPSPRVQAMWENPTADKSGSHVDPLLTTRWSQRPYYNTRCPYDTVDSAYCVTGCVATAMAQIMRYWQWPVVGYSSHSYNIPEYGTLSADFSNTAYRWDLMPDTLNALCDSAEIDAVATLIYHAGVAVEMMYSPAGSGAWSISTGFLDDPCAENALKSYFRYNSGLVGLHKDNNDDAVWDSMLRAELDAARPVYYSGVDIMAGGHAFVIDGYDTLGMFHVNWGWGGNYNAWYTVDSLSPGADSLNGTSLYTFNHLNNALFGVYPDQVSDDTVVTVSIVNSDTAMGTISGSGTYHLYDTVNVMPRAAEGCRYLRMASGARNMPSSFLATHNITDTAVFERIEGDTIGYCIDNFCETLRDRHDNTSEWGIRIPTVMRRGRQLTAVQLYYYTSEGDYTLNVYTGDSLGESDPVYSGVYSLSGEEGWRTLALDSVLTFHHTRTIWIAISYTDTSTTTQYPITCAPYCGNSDGSWFHFPSGWQPYDRQGEYYTWKLRAVFDPRERYHVAASPNDINAGDVTGMGYYTPGATVILNALSKSGYHFAYWSNGSTDNPLHFILTSDTAFVAFFESNNGIGEIDDSELEVVLSGLILTVDNPTGLPMELYDVTGRLLVQTLSRSLAFTLPASGVYILKLNDQKVRKIVAVK